MVNTQKDRESKMDCGSGVCLKKHLELVLFKYDREISNIIAMHEQHSGESCDPYPSAYLLYFRIKLPPVLLRPR